MRVAIYARVSTDDGRQTTENQLRELTAYAERMEWSVTKVFVDNASGKRANPGLLKALEGARRREYDTLLFWSLDRVSREGALKTLAILNQLTSYGVKYRSLQEQFIDSVGGFGDAIIGVIATLAKMEIIRTSSRIRAGLNLARANGVRLGRPRQVVEQTKLVELRNEGKSLRQIAKATGVSVMTVQRLLAVKPNGAGGTAVESIPEGSRCS